MWAGNIKIRFNLEEWWADTPDEKITQNIYIQEEK